MAIFRGKPKRKATGGKYRFRGKKKISKIGRQPVLATIRKKTKRSVVRMTGGSKKNNLRGTNKINLMIKGKAKKTTIKKVVENKASRHFVRQNIISKGAVVETPEGLARITSRPTQDGIVNAVLIKKK